MPLITANNLSTLIALCLLSLTTITISAGLYLLIPEDGHVVVGLFAAALLMISFTYYCAKESRYIQYGVISLAVLIIITGLFGWLPLPDKGYVLIGFAYWALVLFGLRVQYKQAQKVVELKILIGYIIISGFFLLRIIFPLSIDDEGLSYFSFNHVMFNYAIALSIFVSVYSISNFILMDKRIDIGLRNEKYIALIALMALLVLLLGQLVWPLGNESFIMDRMMNRPGGLFNPNNIAAISLIFMFIGTRISEWPRNNKILFISIMVTIVIVALSQSRSAILVLIPYLIYLSISKYSVKHLMIFILGMSVLVMIFNQFQTSVFELIGSILDRLQGDNNSSYRIFLLQQGWNTFLESPWWGNGYRHMYESMGLLGSSHNEVIESLTNFGLIGFLVMCIACYCFYFPSSFMFVFVCIVPMFMFSHNFFETFALQAALGLALSVDRYWLTRKAEF